MLRLNTAARGSLISSLVFLQPLPSLASQSITRNKQHNAPCNDTAITCTHVGWRGRERVCVPPICSWRTETRPHAVERDAAVWERPWRAGAITIGAPQAERRNPPTYSTSHAEMDENMWWLRLFMLGPSVGLSHSSHSDDVAGSSVLKNAARTRSRPLAKMLGASSAASHVLDPGPLSVRDRSWSRHTVG